MDTWLSITPTPCLCPDEVLQLIGTCCPNYEQIATFGSLSPSLYDIAWLSLIHSNTDPQALLFPQCLSKLLQAQEIDGTWPSGASRNDGITVTLAALFAIATNRAYSCQSTDEHERLTLHLDRGISRLQALFNCWNIDEAMDSGSDLIISSLLRRLEAFAIHFDIPERGRLMKPYQSSNNSISITLTNRVTVLKFLEGFVDAFDFENVSRHCSKEFGIGRSPAATAAYLIHSSKWVRDAESYLKRVVAYYGMTGNVPAAFPTPFEISWTISAMLSPVVDLSFPKSESSESTMSLLSTISCPRGRLLEIAAGEIEDAEDIAQEMLTLARIRRVGYRAELNLTFMISTFEAMIRMKTHKPEGIPMVNAHCNFALTLLELEEEFFSERLSSVGNVLNLLVELVETSDRHTIRGRNVSPEYSYMLLMEVFVLALQRHNSGLLNTISSKTLECLIPRSICTVLTQTLVDQESDGSWDQSLETTSYAVLTLSHALRLPWPVSITRHIQTCLDQGQTFIRRKYSAAKKYDYLWLSKTAFQSSLLRIAYCSMALHTTASTDQWLDPIMELFTRGEGQYRSMKKLFSLLPLVRSLDQPLLDFALIESKFHASILAASRSSIFPRGDLPMSKDKYLGYIPVIWLICNQRNKQSIPLSIMGDMLKLSQLMFQVDEYMETVVTELSADEVKLLESFIAEQCNVFMTDNDQCAEGIEDEPPNSDGGSQRDDDRHKNGSDDYEPNRSRSIELLSVQKCLQRFMRHLIQHQAVLQSSPLTRQFLSNDLRDFLLAHIRQNHDNALLRALEHSKNRTDIRRLETSYFTWVHATGANHTSCPVAFRFFTCLIDQLPEVRSCFDGVLAQYLITSVARHLATMCRQYNDYGSAARDVNESNLNSIDFPEFQANEISTPLPFNELDGGSQSSATNNNRHRKKEDLMNLAEFERTLMDLSLNSLAKIVPSSAYAAVKVLVDVTDLFGQLYMAKDIASRKTKV